ncbi:MAG TPA: glycosyl transferase family 2 [Cytophagales bacterium]|nr:glycosyl transferase family 2 [Cytophagales bacterium]
METHVDYFIHLIIAIYGGSLAAWYLVLAIISLIEMREYLKKNSLVDYNTILSSPSAPGISLVAPAYNESRTIIDNVKSLLSITYNNFEVIVVNDGSTDDSIAQLQKIFDLEKVNEIHQQPLATQKVKAIYRSRNKAFERLLIIDKQNGGKADALNVGLNFASNELVACIDVDCIIEPDALLRMVKPFLEDNLVIASGGVVRIANSCVVEDGRLVKVKLPSQLLPRFQVLEYLRAFLLGRMAWSKLNGLLLISGAFGLFKRNVAVQCGGYNANTVGEDMEFVVRMRKYMHEQGHPYRVAYIPDPLCWTEVPKNNAQFGRQRNRWARGTFETLWLNRKLFFNKRYGLMGLVSYPFWFFYEWLSPFIETGGLIYFGAMLALGKFNWTYFLFLFITIHAFVFLISALAIFAEESTYHKYTLRREVLKLIGIALLEPLVLHPRVIYWSIRGNIDFWRGKKSWGEMKREGFATTETVQAKLSLS